MTEIRSGGMYAARGRNARKTCPWAGFQRRGRNARKIIQWMIFSEGRAVALERPEGPVQNISGGSEDDQMKFSYLAVFPPGSEAAGKTVGGRTAESRQWRQSFRR